MLIQSVLRQTPTRLCRWERARLLGGLCGLYESIRKERQCLDPPFILDPSGSIDSGKGQTALTRQRLNTTVDRMVHARAQVRLKKLAGGLQDTLCRFACNYVFHFLVAGEKERLQGWSLLGERRSAARADGPAV